jgi:hypothetical protein
VVPVTRHNLRSLLTQPLRVELQMISTPDTDGGDGDDAPPPPPPGDGSDVEDVVVGLVSLGDILRDEYPEAFGATGLVGPTRGAMFGTPGPAPYRITLLRHEQEDEAGAGGGGGEGALVGHMTVRARFRRSAAAVLALFNGVNNTLETFEDNPHALAAAKGEEPLVVMLAWGSARVQGALGVAHTSVGRLLRNILEDGVVDADEMSSLEAMLGQMEKDVGSAVKEAGEVTVDGVKKSRTRGGVGIGRAERDTLGEAVTALRRSVTSTVATFQSELTDVINKNDQHRGRITNDDDDDEDEDEDGAGRPVRNGLGEVAVRLSATGARLQKDVKLFEATVGGLYSC